MTNSINALLPQVEVMARLLDELVNTSSKSGDVAGNNSVMSILFAKFEQLGLKCHYHIDEQWGNSLIAETRLAVGKQDDCILLVGHSDTVKNIDEWSISSKLIGQTGDSYFGPGCYDMKSGLVQIYYTLYVLAKLGVLEQLPIVVLISPDEEVASPSSTILTGSISKRATTALVFEFARTGNQVVIQRKGRAQYKLVAKGVESHAGNEPNLEGNAIWKMIGLSEILSTTLSLFDNSELTFNPGVISGGTENNTVAAHCEMSFEIRSTKTEDLSGFENKLKNRLEQESGIHLERLSFTPAMEYNEASAKLFDEYLAACKQVGFDIQNAGIVGGLSQANLVFPGLAVLDGIGALGGGAHSINEHVNLGDLRMKTHASIQYLLGKV